MVARTWQNPVVGAGLVMVVTFLIFRALMLKDGWFFQDDYEMLLFARTEPLTLSHLLEPDNGHIMPGTRAVYLLVAHAGWLNWPLAASIALLLQTTAALAALVMLVSLFGARWWVLAPLAIYLTSAITAQAALWWISAVNQTPVQIAFFGSVACWSSYLRRRSGASLAGTLAFLCLGLMFFQKVLLVVPVLIFVMLSYFAEGSLHARVVSCVRRYWPAAVGVGLLSGIYLAFFLWTVPDATPGSVVNQEWAPTFGRMFGEAFASGVVGGPNGWRRTPGGAWADPGLAQLVWAWLVIGLVVLLSLALHRRAGRAWLMLLGYYMLLAALITVTRSNVLGSEIALAYRLQTDGLCAAVLALALAYLPVRDALPTNALEPRSVPSAVRRGVFVPGLLLLAAVCANGLGNWAWFARDFHDSNRSRSYVSNLHTDGQRLGSLELADPGLPPTVQRAFSSKNHLSDLAPVLLPTATFPTTSNDLAVVTRTGQVHQALVRPRVEEANRPTGGCGWRVEAGDRVSVRLTARVSGRQWLRLGYLGTGPGSAVVRVGSDTSVIHLRRGLSSAFVRVGGSFARVEVGDLHGDGVAICLDAVQVGFLGPGVKL